MQTPEWLEPYMPHRGTTLMDEIKCYSLPYGGIGFLSHALTYWALYWLWKGRKPYWPWKKLSYGITDLALSILQMVATVAIASFTIAKCRSRWEFVTIAVWKLMLSLEVGIWGFRASMWARRRHQEKKGRKEGWVLESTTEAHVIGEFMQWFLLSVYALVTITGLVGLVALILPIRDDPTIITVTIVFAAVAGATLFVSFFFWLVFKADLSSAYDVVRPNARSRLTRVRGSRNLSMTTIFTFGLFVGLVSVLMFLFALYCDWALAVIAENFTGVPSADNAALYWTYFAAKRLPLLLS